MTFPPHTEAAAAHPLPAEGSYQASFQVRLSGGATRRLATQSLSWFRPFTLRDRQLTLTSSTETSFALYDALGRLLQAGTLSPAKPQSLDLSLSPPGIYLLLIGTTSYKLTLER